MKAVGQVNQDSVKAFAQESIALEQTLHTDAFAALRVLAEDHHHVAKVTPPDLVDEWLYMDTSRFASKNHL